MLVSLILKLLNDVVANVVDYVDNDVAADAVAVDADEDVVDDDNEADSVLTVVFVVVAVDFVVVVVSVVDWLRNVAANRLVMMSYVVGQHQHWQRSMLIRRQQLRWSTDVNRYWMNDGCNQSVHLADD